jgi:hypothetical protein
MLDAGRAQVLHAPPSEVIMFLPAAIDGVLALEPASHKLAHVEVKVVSLTPVA